MKRGSWKKYIWIILAGILLLGGPGFLPVKADGSIPTDYTQILYDQNDGLGSSEVNCVFQSNSGYIWVGTDGGLYRYNGSEFRIFNLWDTESADVYYINALYQDSAGRLWVATANYGLFYIQGSVVTHMTDEYYSGLKCVYDVCESEGGEIYFATAYGVYTFNEEYGSMERLEELARYNVRGLATANGEVWGIFDGNTIFRINKEGRIMVREASLYTSEELSAIACGPDGTVYIGTISSEVVAMKDFGRAEKLRSGQNGINYIFPYGQRIYVCTDAGVGYFDENRDFHAIRDLEMDSYISSMIVDYEGNYWFSSERSGLLFLGRSKFMDYSTRYGIPSSAVNCMVRIGENVYIGTDDGLVIQGPDHAPIQNALTEYVAGTSIRDILQDASGNIWVSTYRKYGVLKCTPAGEITAYGRNRNLITNLVNCTTLLSDGTIAVGTEEGISFISPDGNVSRNILAEDGLENPNILAICQTKDGTIYAGSDGGGLYSIRGDELTNYRTEDGLTSDVITCFAEGESGLWIGTASGLTYMGETLRSVSNIDYSNNIYNLMYRGGRLYITGSKGILSADETDLLKAGGLSERYYSAGDGLSKKLTQFSRNMMDEDGSIYLCCDTGILQFRTVDHYVNSTAPKLTVSEVNVDGETYSFDQIGGGLTVPANTQRISISFSVLSYTNRENIEVKYKLNGFDTGTEILSGSDKLQAVYTNLDGGSYTLTVTAVNGDGVASENEISFRIDKKEGFFERPNVRIAFVAAGVLLLLLIVLLFHRIRRQFRDKNLELEKLSQEHEDIVKSNTAKNDYLARISNEIKIPMNAIISIADKMIKMSSTDDEEKKSLRTILDTGNDVISKVDETIQLVRLESGAVTVASEPYSMTTLLCDISDRMVNVLADQPVKFLVDVGNHMPDILIGDYEKMKNVLDILLDNAVRFTKEGSITLSVEAFEAGEREKAARLVMSVADTGTGILADQLEHIFEISNMDEARSVTGQTTQGISLSIAKKLADILGGELEAESTYGAGSIFTFHVTQALPKADAPAIPVSERLMERVSSEEAEKMIVPDGTVLFVDDAELNRTVALETLGRMELRADAASSGLSAIDMVMNHSYDMVFMDVAMPVMNGVDTLHEIRELADPVYHAIPVIAMTEDVIGKDQEELLAEGFSDVIVKPLELGTLAALIRKYIDPERIKYKNHNVEQYLEDSRYSSGLLKLEQVLDVSGVLDRIGGNIDVYHRMLLTFYNQNQDVDMELGKKLSNNYRSFRSRIRSIRAGCLTIGASETAEIALRIENAINLGNRGYVRDHVREVTQSLERLMDSIQEYLDFVKSEKGRVDEEPAGQQEEKKTEKTEKTDILMQSAPVEGIDIRMLRSMQASLEVGDMQEVKRIYETIRSADYTGEDAEFMEVLGEQITGQNADQIQDLLATYISLRSL